MYNYAVLLHGMSSGRRVYVRVVKEGGGIPESGEIPGWLKNLGGYHPTGVVGFEPTNKGVKDPCLTA